MLGGALVALTGLFFFVQAFQYGIGSIIAMRAGFFPMALGAITMLIGISLMIEGFFRPSEDHEPVAWRALIAVAASIAVFSLLIARAGFVPAVVAAVLVAALGDPASRPLGTVILSLALCLGVWLIFAYGLGMNLPPVRGWR
jgi:hypothetical protein